ncbi:MAG TPA: response regulator transcription factor [Longimicrobiales bacterium]
MIYVADDDAALRRGLDVALKGRGYAVRTAPDGPALLSLVEAECPDLIVLDVMMPGMSGIDVLRHLRRDGRWRDLPVMMVTAVPDAEVHAEARDGGAAEVLPKPFRLRDLVARIEARVRTGQTRTTMDRAQR